MEKAVGYIRVSSKEQAENGLSLQAQQAKIKAYAEMKDLELIEIIEDAGISAKNLKRPGMERLLKLAENKEIQAVVVVKLDRMFRSVPNCLEVTKRFDQWGVSFHSIQESLDTKTAVGRFFVTIVAALGALEREVIGERTKAVLRFKKENGQKTGGYTPFGYSNRKGALIENGKEQRVIRRVKRLRKQGYNLSKIASLLNDKGIKTKHGKTWSAKQISRIV
jgi:site-specific DNA recombinase